MPSSIPARPAGFLLRTRSILGELPVWLLLGLVLPAVVAIALFGGVGRHPSFGTTVLAIVSGQFLFLMLLLRRYFGRRVIGPASRLQHCVDDLASGRLGDAAGWHGGDELGRLAASIERMRIALAGRLRERQALFDNAPVGVLFVRNRVIELANRQAGQLLGCAPERLAGRLTELIYPTREDYIDIGARAYGAVERGEVFCEAVSLARHDGARFRALLGGCALDPATPQDGSIWTIQPLPGPCAARA